MTGLWEGNFLHFRSLQEVRGIEEERRLAYVALTRAKTHLVLSRPGRVPSGQDGFVNAEISTFWEEISSKLCDQKENGPIKGVGPGYNQRPQRPRHPYP